MSYYEKNRKERLAYLKRKSEEKWAKLAKEGIYPTRKLRGWKFARYRPRSEKYSEEILKCWRAARRSAADRNIEINIDPSDIKIPTHCPILGMPLVRSVNKGTWNTPSVDRLDNTKGYVKGNIWIISLRANYLKSNATSDELFKVARAVELIEKHLKGA